MRIARILIGIITAVICGCTTNECTTSKCSSDTSQPTSKPIVVIRNIMSGNFDTITMTWCDFCGGPIAAPDKEILINRMLEYGWNLTETGDVICPNCLAKRTVLRSGRYF